MRFMSAWGGLAPWGQAAALVILLYVFFSIIIGVVLTAILMFLFAWLSEKAELLKKVRPALVQVNDALEASQRGEPLSSEADENQFVHIVAQVPRVTNNMLSGTRKIDQKVDTSSARVADAVIEFHARTQMVKVMAKAFFLPGLTKSRAIAPGAQIVLRESEQVAREEQHAEPPREMEQEIIIRQSFR